MRDPILSLIALLVVAAGAGHPPAALAASPPAGASSPVPGPHAALVGGTGEDLCSDDGVAPLGSESIDGTALTAIVRDQLFAEAPAELRIDRHLRAAWMAGRDAPGGLVAECLVVLFDTTDLSEVLAWWSLDHPFRYSPDLALPAGGPGDHGHLFEATDHTLAWTYLFRRHNVLAEITLIDPDGTDVAPDDVLALAAAMEARIDGALGREPLAEAPPTETESWLADRVPATIRDTCVRVAPAPSDVPDASLSCTALVDGVPFTVTYRSFGDRDALRIAYEAARAALAVPVGIGGCAGDWPAEESYSIGGSDAGRVACTVLPGGRLAIAWSDERLGILSEATASGVERDALFAWWLDDAGPLEPVGGQPAPTPSPPAPSPSAPMASAAPGSLAGVEGTAYRSRAYGLTLGWPDTWRPTLSAPTDVGDDLRLTNDVSLLHLSTFPFTGTHADCVDATVDFYADHASYAGVTPAVGPDGAPMRGSRTGGRDEFAVITVTYLDRDPPQDLALHISCWTLDGHPGAIARVTLAMPLGRLADQLRELDAILDTLQP